MKDRLVEDWLISVNERGFEVPFCQTLLAKGYKILRCGHSPTEHGKDVLAIAPDGAVCAYQLKSGDFAQADLTKHLEQIQMLVETRPIYPGLSLDFVYRPYFVTTGEFKEPALSLIRELNASWNHRNLPSLEPIGGRQLHADFVALSSDFWPVESPAVRRFRELYLVDGRGDLDVKQYARFLIEILRNPKSAVDLERRVAAANLFSSYLLSEFYKQSDHWSVFQGWTICAAQIAWAGESENIPEKHWKDSFALAKQGARDALANLASEIQEKDNFRVGDRELDDLTRTRNTVAVAGAAGWYLIADSEAKGADRAEEIIVDFFKRGRLFFWGEGALSQFLTLFWFLGVGQNSSAVNSLLIGLIEIVSKQNVRNGEEPFEDPYLSPDECLSKIFEAKSNENPPRRQAVESYSLFPLVILAARRNLRVQLEKVWLQITEVDLTWFKPEKPVDALLWHCEKGKEYQCGFDRPQSWVQLREMALRDDRERMPKVLCDDFEFGIMFMLAFPHRIMPSLIKHLDSSITSHPTLSLRR
jgi:hypothetical protein